MSGRFSTWRQWLLLLVLTSGLVASLGMLQVVLSHYNWRLDLTPGKRFTLSPHARQVLQGLKREVQVVAFLRADDPRNAEIEDLLRRAHNVSPFLHYSLVDVNRNPAVARQYGVDNYASVVVESDGRRKIFTNAREELLVEAILQVTRSSPKVVYFTTGHGEQSLEDTDRQRGYSLVHAALAGEFYEVRSFLLGAGGVPADADVVVIAGPRGDWSPEELAALQAYLARGGSLLVLLDPVPLPHLEAFLRGYGVDAMEGTVVDAENRLFAGDYLTMTVPLLSDRDPVTATLLAPPLFSRARPVTFAGVPPGSPAEGRVRGLEILHTAASSWRTPDREVLKTGIASFAAGRDERGPISVGVSLLVQPPRDHGTDAMPLQHLARPARLIVFGDADFANNFFLDYLGDKDLLLNAINWLAGEEQLMGERPAARPAGVSQFFVSARQGRLAFVLGTIVEPALFLTVGVAVFLRRRWTG